VTLSLQSMLSHLPEERQRMHNVHFSRHINHIDSEAVVCILSFVHGYGQNTGYGVGILITQTALINKKP
jgi:hypothetical protein